MTRQAIRQAGQLVRLRHIRMTAAARELAEARAASAAAQAEREAADAAAEAAATHHEAARGDLAADPAEAERLLAVLDHALFRRSVASGALGEAKDAEQACEAAEQQRRKAMIVARARHDILAERASGLRRTARRRQDERTALDQDDGRRGR